MSEFKTISRQVEIDRLRLEELQSLFANHKPGDITAFCVFESSHSELQLLNARLSANSELLNQKITPKLSLFDPITGSPRYGDNMKQKILACQSSVDEFRVISQELLALFEGELHSLNVILADIAKAEIIAEVASNQEDEDERQRKLIEEVEERQRIHQEQLRQEREQELHKEAEYARFKKRLKAHMKTEMIFRLRKSIESMNDMGKGSQHIEAAVSVMHKQHPNEKLRVQSAVKMLGSILDRIYAKPDDKNIRRIRLSHPMFYNKVANISGALELMIAIGFKLITESVSEQSTTGMETKQGKEKEMSVFQLPSFANLDSVFTMFESSFELEIRTSFTCSIDQAIDKSLSTHITSLLEETMSRFSSIHYLEASESLGYSMIMIMHEPAIDSGRQDELDRWTRWFDEVKACSSVISSI